MIADNLETVLFSALERDEATEAQVSMEKEAIYLAGTLIATVFTFLWLYKKLYVNIYHRDFQDKYVLITGCDSGFGRETAIRLDSLGFNVFATCLTNEGEQHLKITCSKRLTTLQLDVRKSEQIRETFGIVAQNLPENTGLWSLINNAGTAKIGPIEWHTMSDFKEVADVNLWGLIDVTKVFLPLIKRAKGRVINIASIGGRTSLPHACAYSISKFGVEAFSDALRRELSPAGVKVSIIEPGFFRTELTNKDTLRGHWTELWGKLSHKLREEYGETFYQTSVSNMLKGMVDRCASPNTYKVVDSIVHALTSHYPRSRYVVGWDAKLLWIWISRLPASVGDALLNLLGEKAEPSDCIHSTKMAAKSNGHVHDAVNGFVTEK